MKVSVNHGHMSQAHGSVTVNLSLSSLILSSSCFVDIEKESQSRGDSQESMNRCKLSSDRHTGATARVHPPTPR